MGERYEVLKRPIEGLLLIRSESHGQVFQQLWSRAKIRKHSKCCVCRESIDPGMLAYRPLTNYDNRGNRAHPSHFEEAPRG